MTVDIIAIIAIGIIAVFAIIGYNRGLVKTAFSLFSLILTLAITIVLAPKVSNYIKTNDMAYTYIREKVVKVVDSSFAEKTEGTVDLKDIEGLEGTEGIDDIKSLEDIENLEGVEGLENLEDLKGIEGLEGIEIPDAFKDAFKEGAIRSVQSIKDYLVDYICGIVINAVSFVGTFIAVKILLAIIAKILDIVSKLPVLKNLNKWAGFIMGACQGLLILWVICIVLTAFSATEWGNMLFTRIKGDRILSIIYNTNILLRWVKM